MHIKWATISFAVLSCAGLARAETIGSQVISRADIDSSSGQVYIYSGGYFLPGLTVQSMEFYAGATGYVTPILFEQTSGSEYTVRGVGQSATVASLGDQSINFNLMSGSATTLDASYTFGFVNALVNASGDETSASAGVVDFDNNTGGPGVAPGSINDWRFTPTDGTIYLGIGTVYGGNSYPLNAGGSESNDDRTYSATATTVPEPASAGILFVLAAVLAYRPASNRTRPGL